MSPFYLRKVRLKVFKGKSDVIENKKMQVDDILVG